VGVQVSGNGTVVSARGSRALAGSGGSSRIRCGVGGFACYAETQRGDRVQLSARPAGGYRFSGWSGACSGRKSTCSLRTGEAQTVSARFAAKPGRRAVAMAMRSPQLRVKWLEIGGDGTLVVRGSVSAGARLRLDLRRPGGGPLYTKRFRAVGPFRNLARLRSGKLRGGARLFPGGFVVSLRGNARGFSLPLQIRTVTVAAPGHGVVRTAFASTSPEGQALSSLPAGTRQAWANFRFETQPSLATPIAVTWYQPNGAVLGTKAKNNRPVISTGIGSSAGIPSGLWKVELRAGGRLIRTLGVRVG
jgi:hypothetical protein